MIKLSILQEDLYQKANLVSHFVSSKTQLPILSNILLKTEKGKLRLAGTNLDIGITLSIASKIEEEGEITVPAKMLVDILANTQTGKINLQEKNGSLEVSNSSFVATISGIPPNDFPNIPSSLPEKRVILPGKAISEISKQVGFAAASDETRPVLTGINLVLEEKNIIAVATDGFRMSYKEIDLSDKIKGSLQNILIPASLLDEVNKILGKEEIVGCALLENGGQIMFEIGDVTLTGRLLAGQFPDYKKVIPQDKNLTITIDKEELFRAVRLASVFARESANVIKMSVKENQLTFSAEHNQYGKEEIKPEAKIEGDDLVVAYNYRFLLEFLNSVEGDVVVIETKNSVSPGVFNDRKDRTYKHIIMPIRLQEN